MTANAVPQSLEVMTHHVREHARSHSPDPAPLFECCWCKCFKCVVLACEVCHLPIVLLYGRCRHARTHRQFLNAVLDGSWPW